jgi:hypothetical protein
MAWRSGWQQNNPTHGGGPRRGTVVGCDMVAAQCMVGEGSLSRNGVHVGDGLGAGVWDVDEETMVWWCSTR